MCPQIQENVTILFMLTFNYKKKKQNYFLEFPEISRSSVN